ncbi:hypothetical protein GLAREA_10546 [Glarea lozoyensis ATCC 20868]|uniref:Uncharacterized protein n=2 Tax=Glarea lozoyensis TaxID=101852 RepID=S3DSC3_GLAL2|nr:uncharacterized protein GLAREA_10546 [Glarea lozoyensis ATCC 20868]EHK96723.1 hypothetical protein M7I_7526 [Glarea lozoyensis 74030]EPE34851.1 hypothetical protein GLAREA_10546 [Glarea lozoyensis ATCC 20868]
MQLSHIGLIGVFLSSVIGSTIPSIQDDEALSAPSLYARASGGHFILHLNKALTAAKYEDLQTEMESDFPDAQLDFDEKMTTVRTTSTAKMRCSHKYVSDIEKAIKKHEYRSYMTTATWVDPEGVAERSLEDSPSAPSFDKRAGGGHFILHLNKALSASKYEDLQEEMKDDFPKANLNFDEEMTTVRTTSTAKMTCSHKYVSDIEKAIKKQDYRSYMTTATWVDPEEVAERSLNTDGEHTKENEGLSKRIDGPNTNYIAVRIAVIKNKSNGKSDMGKMQDKMDKLINDLHDNFPDVNPMWTEMNTSGESKLSITSQNMDGDMDTIAVYLEDRTSSPKLTYVRVVQGGRTVSTYNG